MAIRDLSVKISAATADFKRGINSAQESLGDLRTTAATTSGSLQVLQGRADEAEDEISGLGRRAAATTGAFAGLTLGTEGLNFAVGTLSTTLTLSLIPALAALSTVLLPLTATLGVFAAALGGVAGTAAVGTLAAIKTETQAVKNAFQSAAGRILEALQPLAEAFLPVIKVLMADFAAAVVDAVDELGDLDLFAARVMQVFENLIDFIPAVAGELFSLGMQILPAVNDAVRFLGRIAPRAFSAMKDTSREVVPILRNFGQAIIESLPQLNELGTVILQETLPALIRLFRGVLTPENIQGFIEFSRNVKPVVTALGSLAIELGGAIQKLGSLNGLLNNWVVIGVLAAFAAVLSGPLGVVAAISAAILAYGKLEDAIKSLQDFVSGLDWSQLLGVDTVVSAAETIGTKAVNAFKTAFNTALPDQFGFALPEQTIDLGPLGKKTIGGGRVGFDFPDNPLSVGGGGVEAASSGGAPSPSGTAGGRPRGPGAGVGGELKITGELTTENGEIVAKIDERVQQGFRRAGRDIDASGVR